VATRSLIGKTAHPTAPRSSSVLRGALLLVGASTCLACVSPSVMASRTPSAVGERAVALAAVPAAIVDETNRVRIGAGLRPLSVEPRLVQAAQLQAEQMAALGTMAHDLPRARYPTLITRLAAVKYNWSDAAENVARNYGTGTSVVTGWMKSEHHRVNILDPSFTQIGTGYALDAKGDKYYAQVFGHPR
jgi:uncharacterized protein YkwD